MLLHLQQELLFSDLLALGQQVPQLEPFLQQKLLQVLQLYQLLLELFFLQELQELHLLGKLLL